MTRRLILVPVLILLLTSCGNGNSLLSMIAPIDRALDILEKGVNSFDDAVKTLKGLKENLDNEKYKKQVEDIAITAGQVGQLSIEGSLDFTRQRIIEDLKAMKAAIKGEKPPARIPVLSNLPSPKAVDCSITSRTTLTLVGWNLDVAEQNRSKYKVVIKNIKAGDRVIEDRYVTYQGQYAITVNISNSALPIHDSDTAIEFQGYLAIYQVPVVNCAVKVSSLEIIVVTTGNDKDQEIGFGYHLTRISDRKYLAEKLVGVGEVWPDRPPSTRSFTIDIPAQFKFNRTERDQFGLTVGYGVPGDRSDPNWIGRIKVEATYDNGQKEVFLETGDFEMGHWKGEGKGSLKLARLFPFNK